ncbi:MAG TPA: MFS transporter [Ktedonosporobacter sp.]|nr:MFS transporter [Ktedonosporobacter sp.]
MINLTVKKDIDRPSVALITSGHIWIDVCQGAVPAMLPFLLIARHLSYTEAAGLVLATNIASSVVQPLFGYLADRVSAPWLMPAGLFMGGIGLGLAGLAPTYWLIALSLVFSGIGIAAFHTEAASLMNTAAGSRRATGMSIFSLGGTVGLAIGPLLTTALLIALGLSGSVLLIVPIAAIAAILISQYRRFAAYGKTASHQERQKDTHQPDAWWPFTRLTATIICRSIIFYGLNTFLPLYWIAVLHQSKVVGGSALTVLLTAGAIGTLIGGRLADIYGRRIVVLIAMALLTPLLLAFVTLASINQFIAFALLIPIGFGIFAPFSVMVVMGQEYLPNHVGIASGVTLGLAITMGGLTVPLFGQLADHYGLQTALLGIAFLPVLATIFALSLPRQKRSLC